MEQKTTTLLATVLSHEARRPPPVWLMRQAGRYLPEYQEMRRRAGSFWTMCMTPDYAVPVTLQPIERFDVDAAILFSDILVVPHALGQKVTFEEGRGPVLGPMPVLERLIRDDDRWRTAWSPVYAAMRGVRRALPPNKSLIGFAGAPWTLAAYMIEGGGSPDQRAAKLAAYRDPQGFKALIAVLSQAVAVHLIAQAEAGADVLQLFDSWAGGLPYGSFLEWVVEPTAAIVAQVRAACPTVRIIGFPRATSQSGYEAYAARTGVDGVSIDTATPMGWAAATLGSRVAIQGNLDPLALVAGGDALDREVDAVLAAARAVPFVFNLGHGVLQETPPGHVARLVARVRGQT